MSGISITERRKTNGVEEFGGTRSLLQRESE
jgi:hypothetical protein